MGDYCYLRMFSTGNSLNEIAPPPPSGNDNNHSSNHQILSTGFTDGICLVLGLILGLYCRWVEFSTLSLYLPHLYFVPHFCVLVYISVCKGQLLGSDHAMANSVGSSCTMIAIRCSSTSACVTLDFWSEVRNFRHLYLYFSCEVSL